MVRVMTAHGTGGVDHAPDGTRNRWTIAARILGARDIKRHYFFFWV
jgi:hypothetical protein